MSGRSYTRVQLPKETLADIQRQTDQAVRAVLSQLKQAKLTTNQASGARRAAVAKRAAVVGKALVGAGAAEVSRRLREAAEAAQATATATQKTTARPTTARARAIAKATARPTMQRPSAARPPVAPVGDATAAEQDAVDRYAAAEAAAVDELAKVKSRNMRLLEVARALAEARPVGVEVVDHEVSPDGTVTIGFAKPAESGSRVDVTVASKGNRVQIDADAKGEPKVIDGQPGDVCVGLDEIFAPMLENARRQGLLRTGPTTEVHRLRAKVGGFARDVMARRAH